MSIETMEKEIIDRSGSKGVSQVSKNQLGLLNWHNILINSNKTVKIYG